jgi:hypothetical protein
MPTLIAAHGFARLQVLRPTETPTSEHSARRSRGVAGLLGDLLARQALAAQNLDLLRRLVRRWSIQQMRT